MLVFSKFYYIFDKIIDRKLIILPIILILGFIFGFLCHKIYYNHNSYKTARDFSIFKKNLSKSFYEHKNENYDRIYAHFDNFDSIFDDFHEMQRDFDKNMAKHRDYFAKIIENHRGIAKNISRNSSEIEKIEDEDSLSYQLTFDGFNSNEIEVKVTNNQLTLKAIKNIQEEGKSSESSFLYSFYITDKFDITEPKITRDKNSITVKFNKKNN